MKVVHLVAHTNATLRPFEDPVASAWAWERLRVAFPCVLVAMLMPNHMHLVAPVEDVTAARDRLARLLGRLGIRFAPGVDLWESVPPPKVLSGRKEILTAIRYVVLNPCHARLVDDPLMWPWSTLRDVDGACVEPWVRREDLAAIFECRPQEVPKRMHAYVGGDLRFASPFPSTGIVEASPVTVESLEAAVAAAMRIRRSEVRTRPDARRLFVALARARAFGNDARIADAIGRARSTISEMRPVSDGWVSAASLCLDDPRLTAMLATEPAPSWSVAAAAGLTARR